MNHASPFKILVADDDEELLALVRHALLSESYEVLVARDGLEAVQQAFAHVPDLVLLDVEMPGADGFEACRRLRSDPRTRRVPIIMLTSRGTEKDILQGFEGGGPGLRHQALRHRPLEDADQDVAAARCQSGGLSRHPHEERAGTLLALLLLHDSGRCDGFPVARAPATAATR